MQRDDVALGEQFVQRGEIDAGEILRRSVPGDHTHAAAERDPGDFAGDAAEADQAQRLAGQLHAVLAQPVAGAHLAVHPGNAARGGPHQRDGGLGYRGVAVAPDQVNRDAEFGQFLRVHVTARAGAQKHHMLEPCAFSRHLGWQRGVIDNRDLRAVEHFGQLIGGHVGVAMDAYPGIAGLGQPFEDDGQRFIGIDKNSPHWNRSPDVWRMPDYDATYDTTWASASTVCISTLAPAVQSACVASSSSLWLMPSLQGTKTIAAGITVLRLQASCPAPEVMRRCEKPS